MQIFTPQKRRISTFYRGAQCQRRDRSIPPEWVLNSSGRGAQSRAEYSARTSDDKEFMLALYNEYQRLMYYTARKYCSDINDCEEVVQEVVLKLINKIPLLRTLEEKALAGYVSVAVRNTAITWLRKQAREHKMFVNWPEEASEIPDTDLGIEESLILKEKKASMLEIWDLMSEEDRFLLEGRYILQYSDNELAEMIGCKASSLRMKMSRVRRKALKLMTERDRGDGSK